MSALNSFSFILNWFVCENHSTMNFSLWPRLCHTSLSIVLLLSWSVTSVTQYTVCSLFLLNMLHQSGLIMTLFQRSALFHQQEWVRGRDGKQRQTQIMERASTTQTQMQVKMCRALKQVYICISPRNSSVLISVVILNRTFFCLFSSWCFFTPMKIGIKWLAIKKTDHHSRRSNNTQANKMQSAH